MYHLSSDGVLKAFDSAKCAKESGTLVAGTIDYGNTYGVHESRCVVADLGAKLTTGTEVHAIFEIVW